MLANTVPLKKKATLYNEANFQGDHFTVGRLGECVEIRSNMCVLPHPPSAARSPGTFIFQQSC